MSSKKALAFMARHGQSPELIDPATEAKKMLEEMKRGLTEHAASIPMIPTYVKNEGSVRDGACAAVIDAGGTNFRSALVRFNDGGYTVEHMQKCKMPGIDRSATWDEFISFTTDKILPLMEFTDRIGFCFSYNAQITPEIDGRVVRIDKEVIITGAEDKLIGASLIAELERRGVFGKRVVVVNDTVAALLGGSAGLDKSLYSTLIGQISGTGANTCCALPCERIPKLHSSDTETILINLESGLYSGLSKGEFDAIQDENSNNPGEKGLEKMSSGVYLGELCRLMLRAAADEDLLSPYTAKKVKAIEKLDSAVLDGWAAGEGLEDETDNTEDADFIQTLCLAVFDRAARCMCANLTAIILLTGVNPDMPVGVCAEGSLVQKGRFFRPKLIEHLENCAYRQYGYSVDMIIGEETTLPGAAVAAILN